MLGGVSGMLGIGNPGDGAAAVSDAGGENGTNGGHSTTSSTEVGGVGPGSGGGFSMNIEEDKVRGGFEEGDRSSGGGGGNRWPRQETLALLKIRSDMDVAFRDSSLKGPLWEEVSRKLAELGYQRSAKKCKEKFENVYKYHRRTKDGRASKSDGKTYRFFDQLQALDTHHHHNSSLLPSLPPPPPPPAQPQPQTATTAMPIMGTNPTINASTQVVSTNYSVSIPQINVTPQAVKVNPTSTPPTLSVSVSAAAAAAPPVPVPVSTNLPNHFQQNAASNYPNASMNHEHHHHHRAMLNSASSSSSTSSDEEPERRRKRKRKWEDYFERLMKEVMAKQEEMQARFIEALEKHERERMAREESWRAQEMARMNREHDLLVHERSIAAAKDAAVVALLQKMSDQKIPIPHPQQPVLVQSAIIPTLQHHEVPQPQLQLPQPLQQQQQPTQLPPPPQQPQPQPQPPQPQPRQVLEIAKNDNNGCESVVQASPSRWPKAEVQALINLRTRLDLKYQENGPKGPLWEEISMEMRKIGYNRSSKRCKEKWENINKYFKKVKESNKRRPEDSKTCPYFHQLDALYRVKNSKIDPPSNSFIPDQGGVGVPLMVPMMVQPEQQWPHPREPQVQEDEDEGDEEEEDEEEEEEEDDEDDDEGAAAGYEVVANKQQQPPMVTAG